MKRLLASDSLRLILSPPAPGAFNMAVDELLLEASAQPVLRLYSWSRAALSLGFMQRVDWIDREIVAREGVDVVRRPTGGRALLHDHELTYALILPDAQALGVAECYREITGWLAGALRRMGLPVEVAQLSVNSKGHPGCYSLLQQGELLLGGTKLVGSAQARRGSRLLQQGAIPLRVDSGRLARLIPLHHPYRGIEQMGFHTINQEQLAQALIAELPPQIRIEEIALSALETAAALKKTGVEF